MVTKMKTRRPKLTIAIVLFVFGLFDILACCGLLAFGFFSFPPTEWITRNYFEGVIAGDLDRAMRFTSESPRWIACKEFTKEAALADIAEFGHAEVRKVTFQVIGSGGSDDSPQVGRVKFQYRLSPNADWQDGYTQVQTDHDDLGFRYSCGKNP